MYWRKKSNYPKIYDNPDVGIWSISIPDAQYANYSKGIEYITGYTQDDFNNGIQWSSIVFPKDLPQYLENQRKLELGKILHHNYRIIHKNGDIKWVRDYRFLPLMMMETSLN